MSDPNLNIHIKALDEYSPQLSGFQASLNNISHTVEDVGRTLRSTGREIGQIGSAFTLLGASITAPMLLAYNNASKYSAGISRQLFEMQSQWNSISVSVGNSMLPIMEKWTNELQKGLDVWNNLSQTQKDNIVQLTFLSGQFLLFGGIGLKVVGEIFKVTADFLLLVGKTIEGMSALVGWFKTLGTMVAVIEGVSVPLWAIYAVIAAIIIVVLRWKDALDYVADAVQKIWDLMAATAQMAHAIWAGLQGHVDDFTDAVDRANASVDDFLNFTPGQHGALAGAVDNVRTSVSGMIDTLRKGIGSVRDFVSSLQNGSGGGNNSANNDLGVWAGFTLGMEEARQKMGDFFTWGKQMATSMIYSMQTGFSSFFNDFFHGQLKKASDYFTAFGDSILKTFSDIIAQMVTKWAISGIMDMFGGISGIIGGVGSLAGGFSGQGFSLSADDGSRYSNLSSQIKVPHFDIGTNYVPNDGLAYIHQGEKIVPANQNRGGNNGGGNVTITIAPVIQAWDANDVYRNRKQLTDAVAQDILNNGALRQVIKQYGN